jgi:hypothetical protein
VQALFLNSIEHDLVYGLSKEALSEAANHIFGVSLIEDLNVIKHFKDFENQEYLSVRLMPQGTDVL